MKPPCRRVKRSSEFREEHVCQKPGGKGVLGGEKKQLYQKLLIHWVRKRLRQSDWKMSKGEWEEEQNKSKWLLEHILESSVLKSLPSTHSKRKKNSLDTAPLQNVPMSLNSDLSAPSPSGVQSSTLNNALLSFYSSAINYLHPVPP